MSNLPGRRHPFDPSWGTTCAWCQKTPRNPATISIQGETDSFGYELVNVCQECADKPTEPLKGTCDYCKKENLTLHHHRDFEEGMNGPVYQICKDCGKRAAEALQKYMESEEDFDWSTDW